MTAISIHQFEQDPLGALRRVEKGESLLVLRDECAIAEIKPVAATAREPRPYGLCAGEFIVPADFDAPLPENILGDFEGA
jgi:antitoxin (DNA-binding transcriptional repressor) of toxin-antitoxin stability system